MMVNIFCPQKLAHLRGGGGEERGRVFLFCIPMMIRDKGHRYISPQKLSTFKVSKLQAATLTKISAGKYLKE